MSITMTISCDDYDLENLEITQDQIDSVKLTNNKPYWFDTLTYNQELEIHLVQQDIDKELDGVILAREIVNNADRFLMLDFSRYPDSLITELNPYIINVRYLDIRGLKTNMTFSEMHRLFNLQLADSRLDSLFLENKESDLTDVTLSNSLVDSIYINNDNVQSFTYYTYYMIRDSMNYHTTPIDYSSMPNLINLSLGGHKIKSIDVSSNILLDHMKLIESEVECVKVHERHLEIFDPDYVQNMTTESCN